tara:strand:+ start:146 stop:331 length:186 start_codon:yes stop_codon:yes gene_type:complete
MQIEITERRLERIIESLEDVLAEEPSNNWEENIRESLKVLSDALDDHQALKDEEIKIGGTI